MAKVSESDFFGGSTETIVLTYRAQVIHSLGVAIPLPGSGGFSIGGSFLTVDTLFAEGEWTVSIAISCCPGESEADSVVIDY